MLCHQDAVESPPDGGRAPTSFVAKKRSGRAAVRALVGKVLTMRGGFHDQIKRSVGSDGLWYEGTMAYHNYALQAMIEIVDAGRRLGLPLHKEPRFRKMIEAPLQCAYPNGQFPAMNDSDPSFVSSFNASFLWA